MTYDVAVWEGKQPKDDLEALRMYEEMWTTYEDTAEPASPRMLAFIADLTSRYADLTELSDDEVDESPWADGPLSANIIGPFVYLARVRQGGLRAFLHRKDRSRSRPDLFRSSDRDAALAHPSTKSKNRRANSR